MSRHYKEAQDFIHDEQYTGEYAMRSMTGQNRNENKRIKSTSSNQVPSESFAQPPTFHLMEQQLSAIEFQNRGSPKCQFGSILAVRTCFAEFLSVYATTFLSIYIEDELSARHIPWMQKISFMALTDAVAATMFITALKTVHFHPAITIAHLFSLSTSWFLCIAILLIQFVAAIFANLSIAPFRNDGLPPYITVHSDLSSEWTKTVYKLMFSQFFGTAMVVVAHLMSCSSFRKNRIQTAKVMENSSCLFMAIALSSFLSLLQSTSHWNSLQATSICLLRSFDRQATESLYDQYLFWLGPTIGSLLACFLYRLISPMKRQAVDNFQDHSNSTQ